MPSSQVIVATAAIFYRTHFLVSKTDVCLAVVVVEQLNIARSSMYAS